jgi:8-oxo-dGTP pyrophosphatase MutT (NUDIX family)
LGKTLFWASWPGLWLLFRWSHRTRLLLVCGDEFLVLRGFLGGGGQWGLPGGGLHRGEEPISGLLRELYEETGIILNTNQIQFAYQAVHKEHGLRFKYEAFVAQLNVKPQVQAKSWEVAATKWQALNNPSVKLSGDTKALLGWWLNQA